MKSVMYPVSFRLRTMRYLPLPPSFRVWEAVAFVSSWWYLPWITLVKPFFS